MAENRFEKALKRALVRWNEAERQTEDTDSIPEMSPAFLEKMNERVRDDRQNREGFAMKKSVKKWKKAWTAAICAAVVLAGTGCVYAAVPAVREYINMLFLREDSVTRLTEVPEGWIGVYTVEDLESVRDDLDGSYILMNDIVIPDEYYQPGGIYENGFTPIGGADTPYTVTEEDGNVLHFTKDNAFRGIFNGNGYVISNLHIRENCWREYVGLFGKVETQFSLNDKRDWAYDEEGKPIPNHEYGYDVETMGGIIKNLGIEDSSIVIDVSGENMNKSVYAGMIAGKADFVAGCYTDNVTIEYIGADGYSDSELENYENAVLTGRYCFGGVVGEATLTDSCWSGADIVIDAPEPPENKMFAAGVCGFSTTCVTSYFNGTIEAPTADWEVSYSVQNDPPVFMTDEVMWEILYRLADKAAGNTFDRTEFEGLNILEMRTLADEKHPDAGWNLNKFLAFYATCKYGMVQDFMTYDVTVDESGDYPYLLDPELKERERRELSKLISMVFEGDEFIEFCQRNGVKYGAYDNYDLRREPDCTYEGFDFN